MTILAGQLAAAHAQLRPQVHGLLLDAITERPVSSAHIINFTDSLATISSSEGMFSVIATEGDSIYISCIGYYAKALIVDQAKLMAELVVVRMMPRQYELAEVEVNPLGSKAQFKERFMELDVDDGTVDVIGVKRPSKNPRTIPVTEDADEIKKAKYLLNPASFIYGNLSKDAKARQELHRLKAEDQKHDANRLKYNEKVVARITGYEGEKIRDFMDFCNFSDSQVYQMNDYQITVSILSRQREFEKLRGRSDR
ncbi:MAG: hypothetical protein K9J06_13795 [Flavobacteriales bacterium]|nr:hypothetical protein [Flavobacteriales bacterium]